MLSKIDSKLSVMFETKLIWMLFRSLIGVWIALKLIKVAITIFFRCVSKLIYFSKSFEELKWVKPTLSTAYSNTLLVSDLISNLVFKLSLSIYSRVSMYCIHRSKFEEFKDVDMIILLSSSASSQFPLDTRWLEYYLT